ncbi:MAG: LytR C-terminal domain-containing protein [Bacteroidota bacterium]
MTLHGTTPPAPARRRALLSRWEPRILALNVTIGVLGLLVVVLAYAFIHRTFLQPPVDTSREGGGSDGIIQIDVLNGCGSSGAATTFTAYLRARGFDVVEVGNYKSFDMRESLVIDRAGNAANAEKVAYALGISKKNIIRQINHGYFVDVSVVIGRDFPSLKPSH